MGRPKGYDRETVLKNAMSLFWKKGFEGSHLSEIVEVTGLNRFSLYKEFGGKEGLYSESMQLYLSTLGHVSEPLMRQPYGLKNIHDYFEKVLLHDFVHGCFFVNAMIEKRVIPDQVLEDITAFARKAEEAILQNVIAAQNAGEIRSEKDPVSLARFLFAFDIGFVTYFIVEKDEAARRAILGHLQAVLT